MAILKQAVTQTQITKMDNLDKIIADFNLQISQVKNHENLEEIRIHFLGKKGLVTEAFANLKNLEAEEKKSFGARVNQVRTTITTAIDNAKEQFETAQLNEKLKYMDKKMGKLLLQILVIKIVLILIVVGGIIIYTYNSI